MEEQQTISYEPDYESKCDNCDATPVVTVVDTNTKAVIHEMGLCGPCCFGEADCLDPANW